MIGNGINLYYENDNKPWKDLILDLWDKHSFSTQTNIPDGIFFTEFYDALEIQNAEKPNFNSDLQKEVQSEMKDWKTNKSQNFILNKIKEMDVPVLTTNFDDLIPRSMDLTFKRMDGKGFTDYYP